MDCVVEIAEEEVELEDQAHFEERYLNDAGFVQEDKEENLAAENITSGYYSEMNAGYSCNYYYRITVVRRDEEGNVVEESVPTRIRSGRLLDNNESIIETDITSDGKNVLLYIPCGLRYDTSYKLKIPDTVLSKNGEAVSEKDIVFTTEQKPFVIGNIEKTVSGTTVKASVAVRNHTAQDKRIYLLVMIYDDNGTLVKMDNIEGDIEKGTEKKVSGEIDVSGIGVGEVKTYIWKGFSFE